MHSWEQPGPAKFPPTWSPAPSSTSPFLRLPDALTHALLPLPPLPHRGSPRDLGPGLLSGSSCLSPSQAFQEYRPVGGGYDGNLPRFSHVPYGHQQSCLCLLLLQQSPHTLVVLLFLFRLTQAAAAAPALAPSASATPSNPPCPSACPKLVNGAQRFSYCPDIRESSLGSSIRCL